MLLSGNFLQMKAFGTAICNSIHAKVITDDDNSRRLISEFDAFYIEEQVRSKCELHKRCLKKFRALPKIHPIGALCSAKEKKEFKIVDDKIMRVVTTDLTGRNMKNKNEGEKSWYHAPILTNNNQDRISISQVRAKSFAEIINKLVVMWLKESSTKKYKSR